MDINRGQEDMVNYGIHHSNGPQMYFHHQDHNVNDIKLDDDIDMNDFKEFNGDI